jgi:hypothetical protein
MSADAPGTRSGARPADSAIDGSGAVATVIEQLVDALGV